MENTRQQAATMLSRANAASNNVSFDGSSALLKAATVGQILVVRELLDQPGIDIDWRDPVSQGRTALHCACKNGHLEVVKLLVDHGASIEATDNNGMTPLLEAAGAMSLDVVRFMEGKGSDINVVAADGRTILHVSAAGNSVSNLEHFIQLPRLTHSLSTRSKNGSTVLLCAVKAGSLEATRFILQRSSRSDILSKTDDGHSCLHYAVISGKLKIISLFQDAGICHHDRTGEGFTAVHYAAKSSDWQPLRAILDYIDKVSFANQNPFTYATLIEPRAPLQGANGTWSVDDFVSGRHLNVPTCSGTSRKTALQLLLSTDPFTHVQRDMVQDLLSRAGIDLDCRDIEQKTPLVAVASRLANDCNNSDLRQAINFLLNRGVDPNTQDVFGRTALHYLCDPVSFSLFIFQAIGDLIRVEKRLADPLSPPPPPPPTVGVGIHFLFLLVPRFS
jgi:ankyrin repeat protein